MPVCPNCKHPTADAAPQRSWGGEKKVWYAIRPQEEASWLFIEDLREAEDHLGAAEDGEVWEVKRVVMTEAEVNALPEFDGW